ncbi:MAG: hypothetical protein CFE21_05990 [Bacteroidetes bacterium B1(2017)]|nr:MAG: hypothetical protein CFE21_05990 [Bacteroidetes bacterium B1(2017)]
MKFKTENNYLKQGWIVLTLPMFKLHANRIKNETSLYNNHGISNEQKVELNKLFENKLKFAAEFIGKLGINYYSLAKRDTNVCFIATGTIKPYVHTKIIFRFYGNISDASAESKFSWNESFQNIDYSIKLSPDILDKEKMILQIDYKEIEYTPSNLNLKINWIDN